VVSATIPPNCDQPGVAERPPCRAGVRQSIFDMMTKVTGPAARRMRNRSAFDCREAFHRAVGFFRDRDSLTAVLARRLLAAERPDDRELADHLVRERRRRSRMDGSIAGSLVLTARAVWELMELGLPPDHAAVVRLAGYLLTRQDKPGRWSEDGRAGDGFFSPGPRSESLAPLVLPSGTVFDDENDARFVASCLALRVVLRAGHEDRPSVRTHLEGLISSQAIERHIAFVALSALSLGPPDFLERIQPLTQKVVARQKDDGTWPVVTVFHAADMLSSNPTAEAREAVRKTAPAICAAQTDSGAFDETDSEHIALIAIRTLHAARSAV
jgi:hypothetical protein